MAVGLGCIKEGRGARDGNGCLPCLNFSYKLSKYREKRKAEESREITERTKAKTSNQARHGCIG